MPRMQAAALIAALLLVPRIAIAQAPERPLIEALGNVYRLRHYTAFDWISAHYLKGTLTLQGFARTAQLKEQASAAARKASGIDDVINQIEVLPSHQGDDDLRVRAYAAIYGSSALERYAPGGQLSSAALSEILDAGRLGLDAADIGRGPHAIHIVVNGARILLLGEVKASGDRRIAEATLRTLPGVLGVTNQLRVAGQRQR
jgi:hyperosmotically inducible periplasmic protein